MNYSTIEYAREKITEYEEDYQELVRKIKLSLLSLVGTTLNSDEKRKIWKELFSYSQNIISKSEDMLSKLTNVRFSESEVILEEERAYLIQKYDSLISYLQKEKKTILRQMEKKVIPFTPWRQKIPQLGHCYFCDISIATGFPYKLGLEEREVLEIELVEGAEFCSQECLLGYCEEYKKREKLRQEEEKKNKDKIEQDKKILTDIQEKIANLIKKINKLEKREREFQLSGKIIQEAKRPGLFRRLGIKLGLVKDNSPRHIWEEIKREKNVLKIRLESTEEELQKAIVMLSIDKQVEQERQKFERDLAQERKKIESKGKEE